jgi:hypothetical protein
MVYPPSNNSLNNTNRLDESHMLDTSHNNLVAFDDHVLYEKSTTIKTKGKKGKKGKKGVVEQQHNPLSSDLPLGSSSHPA